MNMQAFRMASAVTVVLGLASMSSAAITVADYWRMGEADGAGAVNGALLTATNQTTGSYLLDAKPDPTSAITYSSDVPTDPVAGSTLSARLPGSSNYLAGTAAAGTNDFPVTNNFGVEEWVKIDELTTGNQTLFSVDGTSTRIALRVSTGGFGLRLEGGSGGTGDNTWQLSGFTAAAWHHVALVRDNGVTNIYVDGVAATPSVTAGRTTPAAAPATGSMGVGFGTTGNPNILTGYVDELRLFTFAPGEFSVSDLLVTAPVTVPEPATMGLLAVSAIGLLRRRQHS
jgi:hypothetical protein